MEFSLTALKYEDIVQNTINFLIQQNPNLSNFDFSPGSNISIMVNSMAYMTTLLNYQISNVANNVFLDSTNSRTTAVSIAKTMGYIPKRPIAATITGTFSYSGFNFTPSSQIVIPPNQIFLSTPSSYSFVNLTPITLSYVSPILLQGNFILTQGTWTNFSYLSTGEVFQSFVIPDTTVDENNFLLSTTNNSTGNITNWSRVRSFTSIANNSPVYYIQESISEEFCPEVIFGNGLVGKIPSYDDIINVNYLSTLGSQGNNEIGINIPKTIITSSTPDIQFNFANLSLSIPSNVVSSGGQDSESLASIQINAPLFYSTAGVATTQSGYIQTLQNAMPEVYWGVEGAETIYGNNPNYLGNIYICGVPQLTTYLNEQNIYLTPLQESQAIQIVEPVSVLGTYKNMIKPTFIQINIAPQIEVTPNLSQASINTIIANVNTNIQNYFNSIQGIGINYRNSKVIGAVITTNGVVSSSIQNTYGFLINNNSFYTNQNNFLYLPTVQVKDAAGDLVLNDYGVPETTNFIKTNNTIIQQTNTTQNTNYTVTTLPPSLSSIYGTLYYPNTNRIMFSQDYVVIPMLNIFLNSVTNGVASISFQELTFNDLNNNSHSLSLVDSGTSNVWNLYLDSTAIGSVSYDIGFTVYIYPTQNSFLNGLGFTNPLEVIEYNISSTESYYQIQTYISESNMASIILQGTNILGQLTYTSTLNPQTQVTTNTISLVNPVSLTYQGTSYPVTLNATNPLAPILTVGTYAFATITYSNGSFSISNIQESNMNLFGLQGSITLDSNNNLNVLDMYHNSLLGLFNYTTGLLTFNNIIQGTTGNSLSYIPIYQLFNSYNSGHPVDFITIIPDDLKNSSGQIIGTRTDIDTSWSEFLVPNIQLAQLI